MLPAFSADPGAFCSMILTETIMAILSQHEAIITHTAIIAWNVETFVHAASIEVIITFINV